VPGSLEQSSTLQFFGLIEFRPAETSSKSENRPGSFSTDPLQVALAGDSRKVTKLYQSTYFFVNGSLPRRVAGFKCLLGRARLGFSSPQVLLSRAPDSGSASTPPTAGTRVSDGFLRTVRFTHTRASLLNLIDLLCLSF
jgi:hypothetical protein